MLKLHTPMSISQTERFREIEEALRKSWCRETAYPSLQAAWSEGNPALGQCTVTALVVHDHFGGTFAKNLEHNHIWNILPDGTEQDFTREQFVGDVKLIVDEILNRADILEGESANRADTKRRYEHLRWRFTIAGA